MPRIKFTGYVDVADLEPDQVDLDHPSGLSEKGHDDLTSAFSDAVPLKVADLEDIEATLEAE